MKEFEDEKLNENEEIEKIETNDEEVEMVELSEDEENDVGGGTAGQSISNHLVSVNISKNDWLTFIPHQARIEHIYEASYSMSPHIRPFIDQWSFDPNDSNLMIFLTQAGIRQANSARGIKGYLSFVYRDSWTGLEQTFTIKLTIHR